MRTIPYMCLACSEIADVAVPIGETGPGECPMCGGELTCDFDLPVNEHVRVEVQTPERLRFSFPLRIELLSTIDIVAILFSSLLPAIPFFIIAYERYQSPLRPFSLTGLMYWGLYSIFWWGVMSLIAIADCRGRKEIEIDHDQLVTIFVLGPYHWTQRVSLTKISNVINQVKAKSLDAPVQRDEQLAGFCYLEKDNRSNALLTANGSRKIARYVTQLIRRQLTTMGHELQDG
ncbi:hypothetical protein CA54_24250 [Symmachiella macrocystis]|uniref:Uncharacterized protein n=1 Tax=Symmachiella macrocystis TaxID=2527985 RepID=A0A5C6BN71_9PLAN|nr:hypothetical protein [Symmachiella macrocystis]TWU13590.1 hypothetical protein CA54_24250 [Symmachiella macrocystis]